MPVTGEDLVRRLIPSKQEENPDDITTAARGRVDISLDRWDRGLHPPSFIRILSTMENLDETEFPEEEPEIEAAS